MFYPDLPPTARRRRRGLLASMPLAGLVLSGCAATDGADGADEDLFVPTQPIDGVALHAEPQGTVSLSAAWDEVTVSWQALMEGGPSPHNECVGMVSLTAPDNRLIDLNPSLTDCTGQVQLPLGPGAEPGDYRVTVMLNGLSEELIYTVAP